MDQDEPRHHEYEHGIRHVKPPVLGFEVVAKRAGALSPAPAPGPWAGPREGWIQGSARPPATSSPGRHDADTALRVGLLDFSVHPAIRRIAHDATPRTYGVSICRRLRSELPKMVVAMLTK
jgi:hypothetical protein